MLSRFLRDLKNYGFKLKLFNIIVVALKHKNFTPVSLKQVKKQL